MGNEITVKVEFAADGTLRMRVEKTEGLTFPEVKARLERLKEQLAETDLGIKWNGGVEMHIHGPNGEHLHTSRKAIVRR